jgi:enoyl-CoA hydratase/carnithine racemase
MTSDALLLPPPVVLQLRQALPNSGKEVVIVSINRPDRLNCFNSEVCDSLSSIFASLKDDPDVAAVILTGEGTSFCAGADLSNPPNPLVQSSDLPDHLLVNPVHQMSLLQVPIIGALKGYVSSHVCTVPT